MAKFDHIIEQVEVTLANGEKRLAEGSVEIIYSSHSAEPDVGIFSRYFEWDAAPSMSIVLTPMDDEEPREPVALTHRDDLYQQIIAAEDEAIYSACVEDDAEAKAYANDCRERAWYARRDDRRSGF
jgi:hypothetical protein